MFIDFSCIIEFVGYFFLINFFVDIMKVIVKECGEEGCIVNVLLFVYIMIYRNYNLEEINNLKRLDLISVYLESIFLYVLYNLCWYWY